MVLTTTDRNADAAVGHAHLLPIFTPRRTLSVIVIGAGASGLLIAYKLQRHFADFTLDIYEKNPDISGTWFENRYPGCACDVPSHNYTWSFEPKTDWSANYASSEEIYAYFKGFSVRHGLDRYTHLRHKVVGAQWNDSEALWRVDVEDLSTGHKFQRTSQVLINAGGILNAWLFPPISGIKSFQGPLVHSAAWPKEGIDMAGKTVGLIGNGSSGIQILPNIKDKAGKIVTFVREATWVAPPLGGDYRAYTDEEKDIFATDAGAHIAMRKEAKKVANGMFAIFHENSKEQAAIREYMSNLMRAKLKNPSLEEVLIPSWAVGCRRLTPGTDYLESLSDERVQTVFREITQITPTGVICDDGKGEHPVDILICATGFDTTFKPRFPITGTSGASLEQMWEHEPEAYLGIAIDHFPNYFITLGPNCPIGNGPVLISIEAEVDYMIKMLSKFQKENLRSFEVRRGAVRDFNDWKDDFMQQSIWAEPCRSWYKAGSASGKILALWPGSTLHYLEALKEPRLSWDEPLSMGLRGQSPFVKRTDQMV